MYVRRANYAEPLDRGGQRNGSCHLRSGPLGRLYDLARPEVQHPVIERLKDYPYLLLGYHRRINLSYTQQARQVTGVASGDLS